MTCRSANKEGKVMITHLVSKRKSFSVSLTVSGVHANVFFARAPYISVGLRSRRMRKGKVSSLNTHAVLRYFNCKGRGFP
jgi:hypothetical protein